MEWSLQKKLKKLQASRNEIENERARRHLLQFTQCTFPGYRPGWFHERVARILDTFLDDIAAQKSPRLILTAPPQHGKSELVSRRLPAFALGRNPDLQVIATSYSADRAFDFSGDVQRIIDSAQYNAIFPDTRIVGEFAKLGEAKRAAALFQIVGRRGRYRAAGVGGGITGEPANLLIVDDPIKDFSEAVSDGVRESVWQWLTSTAFTRLQEGGGVILMATRWHMDDPVGRLLERQPGRWKVVNFAAIAEEDEPPYRLTGDPLSVERFSLDTLLNIRDGGATSTFQWSALYQQRPSPLGGGIFKRDDWQPYRELPARFSEVLQSWDCAFKDKSSSDFVVGQCWGISGAGRYLLDQVRGHMNFSSTVAAIRQMSAKYPQSHRKLVEDKANGSAVIDYLKNEIPGLVPVQPEGGKEARAHAVSAFVEAHNVYLPADAPWVPAFIEEAAAFPTGTHDDQVDAMTQALNYISGTAIHLTFAEMQVVEMEARTIATVAKLAPQKCPKCGSTCVVIRGPLQHCNRDGYDWPIAPAEEPVGGRRNFPSPDFGTVNRDLVRNPWRH